MTDLSICFTGFSREDEAAALACFVQANASLGERWRVTSQAQAGVLVIDMDSIYGQMSLMKALDTDQILVAITEGSRADTDHLLSRPLSAAALAGLLRQLDADAPPEARAQRQAAAEVASVPAPAALDAPAAPAELAPHDDPELAPTATPAQDAPSRPRLVDLLRPGALEGPVRLTRPDAPDLVLDPATETYLGGAALKPLLPYLHAGLEEQALRPLAAEALPALAASLGAAQPWSRLVWLDALIGGHGAPAAQAGPGDRFRLLRWPQIEREFPRHFRLATVMMKEPATLTQIATLSGVPMAEVIDYVNACLATGVATVSAAQADPAEPGRGPGLLGRFRR